MTDPTHGELEQRLRKQLAAIEHERWSDWQEYLHSKLTKTLNGMMMESPDYNHWETQIHTPYEKLSEREQASDMEQIDRYWPLIETYAAAAHRAGEVEGGKRELKQVIILGDMYLPKSSKGVDYYTQEVFKRFELIDLQPHGKEE